MNNAADTSDPADLTDDRQRAEHSSQPDHDGSQASASSSPNSTSQQQDIGLSQKARAGLAKKLTFLMHLLLSLDTLVNAELCALYYMDCSFFRLMIRGLPHWLYLSPKPETINIKIPNYPVGAIVGPNIVCLLLHILTSLPQAGEAARGYLHGGIIIDFVGQKPPTSKLTFVLLDLMLLNIQCVMLAVSLEKDRVKKIMKAPKSQSSTSQSQSTNAEATTASNTFNGQDHDAEERGVLRDAPTIDETHDIELQPLTTSRDHGSGSRTLNGALGRRVSTNHEDLAEILSSGNGILSEFNVRTALRAAYNDNTNTMESAGASALQSLGYNATLAALAAQRRARLAAAQNSAQAQQP